jgi:hypothetical protein
VALILNEDLEIRVEQREIQRAKVSSLLGTMQVDILAVVIGYEQDPCPQSLAKKKLGNLSRTINELLEVGGNLPLLTFGACHNVDGFLDGIALIYDQLGEAVIIDAEIPAVRCGDLVHVKDAMAGVQQAVAKVLPIVRVPLVDYADHFPPLRTVLGSHLLHFRGGISTAPAPGTEREKVQYEAHRGWLMSEFVDDAGDLQRDPRLSSPFAKIVSQCTAD